MECFLYEHYYNFLVGGNRSSLRLISNSIFSSSDRDDFTLYEVSSLSSEILEILSCWYFSLNSFFNVLYFSFNSFSKSTNCFFFSSNFILYSSLSSFLSCFCSSIFSLRCSFSSFSYCFSSLSSFSDKSSAYAINPKLEPRTLTNKADIANIARTLSSFNYPFTPLFIKKHYVELFPQIVVKISYWSFNDCCNILTKYLCSEISEVSSG